VRVRLHATEGGSSAAAIDVMSWEDFELLIAEAFRLQGFAVVGVAAALMLVLSVRLINHYD